MFLRQLESFLRRLEEAVDADEGWHGVVDVQIRTGRATSEGPAARPGASAEEGVSPVRPTPPPSPAPGADVPVSAVREPVVDVYDEGDRLLIVAELPGVSRKELSASVDGDVFTLSATTDRARYRTEVLLPRPIHPDLDIQMRNGILTLTGTPVMSREE